MSTQPDENEIEEGEIVTDDETEEEIEETEEEVDDIRVYKGRGCPVCNNSGHKGRVALMEVMEMTDQLREMVLMGANAVELKRQALEDGMITLRRSGLIKISKGVTSIEEVVRETVL